MWREATHVSHDNQLFSRGLSRNLWNKARRNNETTSSRGSDAPIRIFSRVEYQCMGRCEWTKSDRACENDRLTDSIAPTPILSRHERLGSTDVQTFPENIIIGRKSNRARVTICALFWHEVLLSLAHIWDLKLEKISYRWSRIRGMQLCKFSKIFPWLQW